MGTSTSNNKSIQPKNITVHHENSKFQKLMFQQDQLSSRSSKTQQQKLHQINQTLSRHYHEVELSNGTSNYQSEKNNGKNDSVMSNYDKLSIKSSRIQKLNQILDDEIKNYKQDKKQKNKEIKNSPENPIKKPKRKHTQVQSVILGIWIGITISIVIVLIAVIQINNLSIANESQFSRDFPTWRGIAIWIFYVWMIGFDIYMFERHKIRYRQIFKIKPNHYPEAVNIYRIAGFHSSIFVVLFLFYVLDITKTYHIPGFTTEYFAAISWGLCIVFLFMPLPIFSNKGRFFMFKLMIDSILSPFQGVTFPITWMTDQAVSMAVPLKDLEYTICYYTQLDFQSSFNTCLDSNRISTVLIVAVSICSIRMVQCIRQGYDKGQYFMTPFFFNTLKYAATVCTAVFAFEYKLGADQIQAAWLLFAIISSFYSFVWDLKMDWDLLQKNKAHPFLRQKLTFGSANIYYLILVGNFIMRLAWIITISPKLATFLGNNNLVFLVTGLIQIFRRGIWNLLRVQKQHLTLVNKPPKSSLLEQKTLQLERKLATVENSLSLQIKMLQFFKKFESNRQNLRSQIERIYQGDLQKNQTLVQAYNKQFEQGQMNQISDLMNEMLNKDIFLKKRLQRSDKQRFSRVQVRKFEQQLMNEQNKDRRFSSQIIHAKEQIHQVQQIKAELKQIQDMQQKINQNVQKHHKQNLDQ